jgi:uncharacterized membrane-anchored protein
MRFALPTLVLLAFAPQVSAQAEPAPTAEQPPPFEYSQGPLTGALGDVAQVQVPSGYAFVDKHGMPDFNKATGNLTADADIGALFPTGDGEWVAFFQFQPVGYIKDDDKNLDADELLSSIRSGDDGANEERREQGLPELVTVDWSTKPHYDEVTHNLTWGLKLSAGTSGTIINHQIRLLGRRGVMSVIIADRPETISQSVAEFSKLIGGLEFVAGEQYAEFKPGDKIAEYGLTGLMLGGGALLAAKSGLLSQLGKFIKLIVVGILALFAAAAKWLKNLFRGTAKRPAEA